jgi:hypothetical protein
MQGSTRAMPRVGVALALGVVLLVAAPAAAHAATVVGSSLTRSSDTFGYCTGDEPGSSCTVLQLTLGTASQAVPYDGVVTSWAVRDAGGSIALRVVEGPPGQRRVVAAAPPVFVTGAGVQRFPAQQPVRAGQSVGLELAADAHVPFAFRDEQTRGEIFVPPLSDVPTAPVPDTALAATYELFLQYTVEPDADRDGLGDETQDPDRGGVPPAGAPGGSPGAPGVGTGGGTAACPTTRVVARGPDAVVVRQGNRLVACRSGVLTRIGSVASRTRFRLYQFNGNQLALVRVRRGVSSIRIYDLATRRRTFRTRRTSNGGPRRLWRVTDLVVAPNGNAAWIATLAGRPGRTSVWVRSGRRIQNIDQGRIRPTSLTLAEDATGVNYFGANGSQRNSSFG